jgi:uncharacterized protein (TIGR02246 family)
MTADTTKAEIGALIEAWAAAVHRKDMDGILAHHADDFVMFDVPPPLVVRGLAAYRETWPLFFDASPNPPAFDIRELTVEAGDTVAFAAALMRCLYEKDGAAQDLDFRLTIGFRKIDGRWMFVHEHHSVPAAD